MFCHIVKLLECLNANADIQQELDNRVVRRTAMWVPESDQLLPCIDTGHVGGNAMLDVRDALAMAIGAFPMSCIDTHQRIFKYRAHPEWWKMAINSRLSAIKSAMSIDSLNECLHVFSDHTGIILDHTRDEVCTLFAEPYANNVAKVLRNGSLLRFLTICDLTCTISSQSFWNPPWTVMVTVRPSEAVDEDTEDDGVSGGIMRLVTPIGELALHQGICTNSDMEESDLD